MIENEETSSKECVRILYRELKFYCKLYDTTRINSTKMRHPCKAAIISVYKLNMETFCKVSQEQEEEEQQQQLTNS